MGSSDNHLNQLFLLFLLILVIMLPNNNFASHDAKFIRHALGDPVLCVNSSLHELARTVLLENSFVLLDETRAEEMENERDALLEFAFFVFRVVGEVGILMLN